MRFVVIYGPPAVGKLTVARELAARTGFRLFDNHVSIEAVKTVFEFGTPAFGRIVDQLRAAVFHEASAADIDLIFTFVYAKGEDDDLVTRWLAPFNDGGHQVAPVRLYADARSLMTRVEHAERRGAGKVSQAEHLREILSRHDLDAAIPHAPSLSIDTAYTAPQDAATAIIEHYDLPTIPPPGSPSLDR